MKKVIAQQLFYGGRASDDSLGTKASFGYSQSLDFRTNPSKLSVLPGARKISNDVVQDLILNITQVPNGTRYANGDSGYIYKIDTDNVVTYLQKLDDGSDGALYRQDTDAIYFAGSNSVRRYYPLSSTTGVNPSFDLTFKESLSTDSNAYLTGGVNTYSVPTSIDEGTTHKRFFSSDIEPFYSIKVNVRDKGTGDWTLTLHDGLNNSLGSVTKPNAQVTSGLNEFVFSSPIRALVKPNARTYHFHLTSTAVGSVVFCASNEDLSGCDMELYAYRMVEPVNGLHPMIQFQQFICIGNERYLSVWEPLSDNPPNNEWQRHRLVFPPGFEVCSLATTDEFLVIGCEKRSTDATREFQEGKLFIWDGSAQTYNQVVDVDNGAPYSAYTKDNFPYFIVGDYLCAWPGGKNIIKVRRIANSNGVNLVYPNNLTTKNNILLLGFPSSTTDQSVEHGVYSWGSLDMNYPASFGYDYLISTQTKLKTDTNNLTIGCTKNFGSELYLSWRDGSAYGLDIVDALSEKAPTAKFRARTFDAKAVHKPKLMSRIGIFSESLPEGVTLTPVFSKDGGADETLTPMTTGSETIQDIPSTKKRMRTVGHGFDIATENVTDDINVLSVALEWDELRDEKAL